MKNDVEVKEEFDRQGPWGLVTTVDLKGCNPDTIRDAEKIKEFVKELCIRIDMKRFGDTVVVDFGDDDKVAGFSMTQLIMTSLISGHFVNATNEAYLDIFSCKYYPPYVMEAYCKEFFEATGAKTNVYFRQA